MTKGKAPMEEVRSKGKHDKRARDHEKETVAKKKKPSDASTSTSAKTTQVTTNPSTPPRFDRRKFVSAEAAQNFKKDFSFRPVTVERKIDLPASYPGTDFESLDKSLACREITTSIAARGWEKLKNIEFEVFPDIVREFYANIAPEENVSKSFVRGKVIDYSWRNINRLLDIPLIEERCSLANSNIDEPIIKLAYENSLCDGRAKWLESKRNPGEPRSLIASSMSIKARLWWSFVSYTLLPITHHYSITSSRLLCLKLLMEDVFVNAGLAIENEISSIYVTKKSALSYGGIISQLCKNSGVKVDGV